jgi:endonuclease-8
MPEGDTIHRVAARLRPALEGATLTRFSAPRLVGDRPKPGTVIESVEARGKNLLVHFAGGLSLRTHLRMTGSWHLYRTGERWQRGAHLARAVLEVDTGWVAVCFAAPVVETYHRQGRLPAPLATLGPDLCAADADLDAALERLAALSSAETEIANALLDQRVASGIGNIYKSETLWACGADPFALVVDIDGAERRRVFEVAHKLLRANLGTGARATYEGGLAVYGRRGQPCRRCGTPIRVRRQGEQARSTYWCPVCQPPRRRDSSPPEAGRAEATR